MKFDSVIIGGGLSGLLCGLRLAQAGQRCAIISSGQSALHFSSGSLDLLGTLPDGTAVENPVEAVERLAEQSPQHPYVKLGRERFAELADEAAALIGEYGGKVAGSATQNHYRLTPMGTLKPTWLTMEGYLRSDSAERLPWSKVALFNAEGFLDFYAQFIADSLREIGTVCSMHTFNMPALEQIRSNPSEMRSANIARVFDHEENIVALAHTLADERGESEAVLLPAVLGIDRRVDAAYLTERVGCPVVMVATLPPSVPGLQMQIALRRAFEHAGGVYMLGDVATGYDEKEGRITAVYTENHRDIPFLADNYVLATGSYFSRGLVADVASVREPLFGVDVAFATARGEWYDKDLFATQPLESFGIITDKSFHALRSGCAIENLYAVGAGLSGFNPIKEGCGGGVSALTALAAADEILNKQK